MGLLAATFAAGWGSSSAVARSGLGGSTLATFAVGCAICNKLVVSILGVSGALTYFAPVQPALGAAGLALAGWALAIRMRSLDAGKCRIEVDGASA